MERQNVLMSLRRANAVRHSRVVQPSGQVPRGWQSIKVPAASYPASPWHGLSRGVSAQWFTKLGLGHPHVSSGWEAAEGLRERILEIRTMRRCFLSFFGRCVGSFFVLISACCKRCRRDSVIKHMNKCWFSRGIWLDSQENEPKQLPNTNRRTTLTKH